MSQILDMLGMAQWFFCVGTTLIIVLIDSVFGRKNEVWARIREIIGGVGRFASMLLLLLWIVFFLRTIIEGIWISKRYSSPEEVV